MVVALRVLMLVAALAMPFSIVAARGMVHPGPSLDRPGPCEIQCPRDAASAPSMTDCAFMCTVVATAAAIPSAPLTTAPPARLVSRADAFTGIVLELATPPPKTPGH